MAMSVCRSVRPSVDTFDFYDILRYIMVYYDILWYIKVYYGILWYIKVYYGILWYIFINDK